MTTATPLPLFDAPPARPTEHPATHSARLLASLGRPVRYHLVTLGCPKNVVDSETFERRLTALGCVEVTDPDAADVLVANTCGFIEQSQQESINAVLALAGRKRKHQTLIAAGCLVSLNRDELRQELPEISGFFDPREWDATVTAVAAYGLRPNADPAALSRAAASIEAGIPAHEALRDLYQSHILREIAAVTGGPSKTSVPAKQVRALYDIPEAASSARRSPLAAPRISAYLKISDGCNAPCTFCIIPQIKGRFTSISAGGLVAQAKLLRGEGARELVLVAQDSTAYGEDLGIRDALPDLLRLLAEAVPDVWLRLMYAYPGRVSDRLIKTMAELPQVVRYLDVPLQHGAVATLRRMRRPANMVMVRRMIADLRAAMPDIALRTSLIAGFPGETEAEFEEMLEFVREVRFDHAGVFTYSQQERAVSGAFEDQVPERVKRERRRRVMELQQTISLEKHQELVGHELTVLVEATEAPAGRGRRRTAGPVVTGRSYRDAPEVDGLVICPGDARPGEFVRVRVTEAMPYDLAGEIIGIADPFARPQAASDREG
jgi:ribosomal protein S12 methylthiotransferase